MNDIKETVSGFKVKGNWGEVVKHGERITVALQSAGCSGKAFEEWDEWRPKAHERFTEEIIKKTAEQAHITKGPGERANQSPGDDLQHAGEKLADTYEQLDDADKMLDDGHRSLWYLGRAADSASRKALRLIEDTIYTRVMTKVSPPYFDNDLVSANIQQEGIRDNDQDYIFEVNINDDNLKITVSEYLKAQQEIDRWHIETEPATNRVEAAEGVDAPDDAGVPLRYTVDNQDRNTRVVEDKSVGGPTTPATVIVPRAGEGNHCIDRDDIDSMTEVKLNCSDCGHRWTYDGNNQYATCPNCGRSVWVKR